MAVVDGQDDLLEKEARMLLFQAITAGSILTTHLQSVCWLNMSIKGQLNRLVWKVPARSPLSGITFSNLPGPCNAEAQASVLGNDRHIRLQDATEWPLRRGLQADLAVTCVKSVPPAAYSMTIARYLSVRKHSSNLTTWGWISMEWFKSSLSTFFVIFPCTSQVLMFEFRQGEACFRKQES